MICGTPAPLNYRRPSAFSAACPGCGRTLLGLLAALSASLPAVFAAVTVVVLVSLFPATVEAQGDPEEPCPGGGYNPTPVAVAVTAVPIVVASTTADYFVLYVRHTVDGSEVEFPVLVKRGEVDTTTLAENVAALPKERYRVEKYLIADPADVDGDCIDDLTELTNLGSQNPVNPAAGIALTDGAVAIPDEETFTALSEVFASRSGGWTHVVKFFLGDTDTDRPLVYFMNTSKHLIHQSFIDAVGPELGRHTSGKLTYHPELVAPDGSQGLYYFSLNNLILPAFSHAERSYTQLAASMRLLDDNLAVYIPNRWLSRVQSDLQFFRASRMHLVFDEDLFSETDFQALNPGEGYGRLRALEPDERPHPRDIVLYEALPNELPRVAGIISTVPQTPLSHVNLRAVQDGVPNAFIRGALDEDEIDDLIGSYVRYTVTETGWDIRAATRAQVDAHYTSSRPTGEQTPQRDLSVTTITPLGEIGFEDWTAFGVKAANVAVLGMLGFPTGTVPTGFAIPFYFYDKFMTDSGLYDDIKDMLAASDFQTDFDTQESELKKLRKAIKDAETPQWIIDALTAMHATYPEGQSLRYRSSTNNEDLPGFNGAGLYDSKTQHPDETDEDGIDKSLKQVYASLWNFRAFTERDFNRIDHLAAKMGVLVHPNYSDELANGVAVSFDPIRGLDGDYYVNTQVGEDLVTNPEPHSVPEELLLSRDTGRYIILYFSNLVEPGELLLSDAQVRQLRDHLTVIHERFAVLYNPAPDEPFAMEIEFKITSDNVLAIKQARPWVFSGGGGSGGGNTGGGGAAVESITSSATHPTKDGFTVTITFSELVMGLEASEITVTNGTGSNFAGAGAIYTLEITPNTGIEDDLTVTVTAGAVVDGVNKGNLEASAAFSVDTKAPVVSTVAITSNPGPDATYAVEDEIEVTVRFSETVEVEGTPRLTLKVGSRNRTASYRGSTDTDTLTFVYEVADGDEDTDGVSIDAGRIALNGGKINDEADNPAELVHEAVATQVAHKVDGIRPSLLSAAVDGASLTLTYMESLDGGSRPATGDFTVEVDGAGRSVTGVSVSGSVVTLTLSTAVEHGDTGIRVSYTPGTNPIQDAVGNDARGLSNQAVTNTTGAPNTAPEITTVGPFTVRENQALVRRLAARDDDSGDEVTGWSIIGGADQPQFSITSDTGDLSFQEAPDYESPTDVMSGDPPSGAGDNEYVVTVEVRSGAGARELEAEQTFTVRVTDEREPPGIPEAPAFSGAAADSLTVHWRDPENTGPAITDYGVRYRKKGPGRFIDAQHMGPGLSLTLDDLEPGTAYEVQVQATNDEGTSDWSDPGEGMTVTPLTVEMMGGTEPPVEGPFTVRFSFSETVVGFTRTDITTQQEPACTDSANNPISCNPTIAALQTTDDRIFTTTVTPRTERVAHNYTLTLTVSGGAVRSSVGNKRNEEAMLGGRVAPPGVTVPISEIGLTASGLDRAGRLNWNRPANDGGSPIIRYEYRYAPVGEVWNDWENVGAGAVGVTVGNLVNGLEYVFEVRAVNALGKGPVETAAATPVLRTGPPPPPPPPPGPRETVPDAPTNLLADGGNEQVALSWEAPEDDGGFAITDYEVRINGRGSWISTGSIHTTHTVTGLTNGTAYVFQVRAVNAAGSSPYSNRAEATPGVGALDFAHFANGAGIISDLVFVNVATHPIRPGLYFYDKEGNLIDPESMVDLTEDLEVTGDGALSIWTEMEPLGELTISTHGRGELVSGSVKVAANGLIGGVLRFDLPGIGVAGVGASQPVRDALFPARRQAGGISTAAAIHNIEEEAIVVSCHLMSGGVVLEEMEIALAAYGQEAQFIEEMFTTTDTSNFVGLVRCTAPGLFTGIAVELDAGNRIFTTLPVVPVARAGGGGQETVLYFAHFANGNGTTSDLVFVNVSPRPSGPGPTPYHATISPSRPALYFYDQEGHLMDPASVVDLTGDLEITGDGALSIQTEMEPLGELTISTHGRGALVSGSVTVVSEGPIGGVLRYALPGIGVTGVGSSPPVQDALFPVRQEGGLATAAAIRNLTESDLVVTCRLMKDGAVLEEAEIPLEANGQEARYIEELFPTTDTSNFVGSVRCTAPGEGLFTGVAVELDPGNRIFTTLPVVPVPERTDRE